MKKNRIFMVFMEITLLLPAFFMPSKVSASYPSFSIYEVKTDLTVTLSMKDLPKNLEFRVLLGEYNTLGVDGVVVAHFNSGEGGSSLVTVDIPAALQGRAMISVRIESLTGGYFAYNWFWNDKDNGTWPGGKPPVVTPEPPVPAPIYPFFSIKAVEAEKNVTISAKDFPKEVEFVVRMGKEGTRGINGIIAAEVKSSDTGAFEATFPIPTELANEKVIAIRLDAKVGGWYAYNWFYNKTASVPAPQPSEPTPLPAPVVQFPTFSIKAVEKGTTVTISGKDFPKETEFTVLMGKYGTAGINGTHVAEFNTGEGGALEATFDIPAALAGDVKIAIRLEAKTGGYFAYNWFWNNTATVPAPQPSEPTPLPAPVVKFPTFSITAVAKGTTVSISGIDFPKETEFTVLMGKYGTAGIDGIQVAEFNTGEGGALEATFEIPAALAGDVQIAIRLQAKTGGWFAYNWFWNNTVN